MTNRSAWTQSVFSFIIGGILFFPFGAADGLSPDSPPEGSGQSVGQKEISPQTAEKESDMDPVSLTSDPYGSVITSYFASPGAGRVDQSDLLAGLVDANRFNAAERLGDSLLDSKNSTDSAEKWIVAAEMLRLYERMIYRPASETADSAEDATKIISEKVRLLRRKMEGLGLDGENGGDLDSFAVSFDSESADPASDVSIRGRIAILTYALNLAEWKMSGIRHAEKGREDAPSGSTAKAEEWRTIFEFGRRLQPVLERAYSDAAQIPGETSGSRRKEIEGLTIRLSLQEGIALTEIYRSSPDADKDKRLLTLAASLFQKGEPFADPIPLSRLVSARGTALRLLNDAAAWNQFRQTNASPENPEAVRIRIAAEELRARIDSGLPEDFEKGVETARNGTDADGNRVLFPTDFDHSDESEPFYDFQLARIEILLRAIRKSPDRSENSAGDPFAKEKEIIAEIVHYLDSIPSHPKWNARLARLLTATEGANRRFSPGKGANADVGRKNNRSEAEDLYHKGETQKALNLAVSILKESPDDADSLFLLAEILADQKGEKAQRRALAVFLTLADRFPEGSEKWFRVREREIDLFVRFGRRAEAEKMAAILEIAFPDFGDPERKERIDGYLSR